METMISLLLLKVSVVHVKPMDAQHIIIIYHRWWLIWQTTLPMLLEYMKILCIQYIIGDSAKSHLIDWISLVLFTLILGHLSDKEWCPTTFCFVGINAAMILYSFVPFKCKIIWRLYIRVHIRWCYIELILIHVCTETVNASRNSKILTVFLFYI